MRAQIDAETLRALVREVLSEELGAAAATGAFATTTPAPAVREERVAIASDAELMAFVRYLLELSSDGHSRAEIEQGRWLFKLDRAAPPSAPAVAAAPVARFERGLVSERQVAALPADTRTVQVGKRVRLTPLAADELRRRGIRIDRAKS